jgi:hypothetical protein
MSRMTGKGVGGTVLILITIRGRKRVCGVVNDARKKRHSLVKTGGEGRSGHCSDAKIGSDIFRATHVEKLKCIIFNFSGIVGWRAGLKYMK